MYVRVYYRRGHTMPAAAARQATLNDTVTADFRFELKSADDDERIIEGIATTPTTDRMGDIVESKGAQFKLPLKLLWQHDKNQPIGHVIEARVTDAGIRIKAKLERGIDFIDKAWMLIKARLVSDLSIGFRPIEMEDISSKDAPWATRFKTWEWLELSAVTIPANANASIEMVRAMTNSGLTVSGGDGRADVIRLNRPAPGVPGKTAQHKTGSAEVKTTGETIVEFQGRRSATAAQMVATMEKANTEGRTLDTAEKDAYDAWVAELHGIDEHLVRLKGLEVLTLERATPVTVLAGSSADAAGAARGGNVITVKANVPRGTSFARYAQALAVSKGNLMQAEAIAQRWNDTTPEVGKVLKAAVAAGTTTDSDWAAPLVEYTTMANEFIDLLRPATIIGKVPGLRSVPFNIRVAGKTQGSTVGWVGEGASKPVSELKFNEVLLGWAKCAGIVVITQELARFSSPSAEGLIRTDLVDSISQFLDVQFIDPAVAAVANVHPASITNGVTAIPSSGGTLADIYVDLTTLFGNLATAQISPVSGVWITTPAIAIGLSMLRTTQDVAAFPTMTMTGGSFMGFPVVVSAAVPTGLLIFVVANEVFLADDGQVMLDASQQASVSMDSAPTTPGTTLVSLWQQNLVGIKAERYINWQKRRAAAVQVISGFIPAPAAPLGGGA